MTAGGPEWAEDVADWSSQAFLVLADGRGAAAEDLFSRIASLCHDGNRGLPMYSATCVWGTVVQQLRGMANVRVVSDVIPDGPDLPPTQAAVEDATALGAWLAAYVNGDQDGAIEVWMGLDRVSALTLAWHVLELAADATRDKDNETADG